MSIHPSLSPSKGKKARSVLKRFERVEKLRKEGKWKESSSAFKLPKTKILKLKLKKTKGPAKAEEKKAAEKKPAEKKSAGGK